MYTDNESDYDLADELAAKTHFADALVLGNEGSYNAAIERINNAIILTRTIDSCWYFEYRAVLHQKLGKYAEAITDYSQAINILLTHREGNYERDIDLLKATLRELLLSIDSHHDLSNLSKSNLVNAIKLLGTDDQIKLFNRCLDNETGLGKCIWLQTGMTPCSMDKGTLKEIWDYLKEIDPNYVAHSKLITMTTNSIFLTKPNSFHNANFPKSDLHNPDDEKTHGFGL